MMETEGTTMFLKNGYDLTLTLDTKDFDETIVYKGKGANENNYLAKKLCQMKSLKWFRGFI